MGQSVFKIENIKSDFLKKIEKLPSAQKTAAIAAWNLLLGKLILSATKSAAALTLKKTKDSILLAKKKVQETLVNAKYAVNTSLSDQGLKLLSGYKDPAIDSMKSNLTTAGPNQKKSLSLKNLTVRSEVANKMLGDKIKSLQNDMQNYAKLKI